MDGVMLTRLKKIYNPKGDILHAMKKSDDGYDGFGEAYFSTVKNGVIKGWKQHKRMTLNLVVVAGSIEFVIYDGIGFYNVNLSRENYQRLTIRPGLWVAFRGLSEESMLLNLANIEHDPNESISVDLEEISYDWE